MRKTIIADRSRDVLVSGEVVKGHGGQNVSWICLAGYCRGPEWVNSVSEPHAFSAAAP
jgi:hypothetical protein